MLCLLISFLNEFILILFFLLYYFSFGLLDVFYVFVQGKTQEKKLNFSRVVYIFYIWEFGHVLGG